MITERYSNAANAAATRSRGHVTFAYMVEVRWPAPSGRGFRVARFVAAGAMAPEQAIAWVKAELGGGMIADSLAFHAFVLRRNVVRVS